MKKPASATNATEKKYRNPVPTVDIIIEIDSGIVLIRRKNPPFGWAIPGGFIEYRRGRRARGHPGGERGDIP